MIGLKADCQHDYRREAEKFLFTTFEKIPKTFGIEVTDPESRMSTGAFGSSGYLLTPVNEKVDAIFVMLYICFFSLIIYHNEKYFCR